MLSAFSADILIGLEHINHPMDRVSWLGYALFDAGNADTLTIREIVSYEDGRI